MPTKCHIIVPAQFLMFFSAYFHKWTPQLVAVILYYVFKEFVVLSDYPQEVTLTSVTTISVLRGNVENY